MIKNNEIKKIIMIILCIIISSFILTSCGGMTFDPRAYNKKYTNSKDNNNTPEVPPDIDIPEDNIPEADDPFKNGDWNKPDYNDFDASKFDEWFIKVSFDDSNIPIYAFFVDSARVWTVGEVVKEESTNDGSNDGNKAGKYDLTDMTLYRYKGKNPLVDPLGSYNTSTNMKRFYFYRFTGFSGAGGVFGVNLDNFLIAVDTYSKLIFAYGKITSYDVVFGQKVPKKYEAFEFFGDKRSFYQYDPIGIVRSDGTVELYQSYKDSMKKDSINFFPKIVDFKRDIATYGKEGRSPYLPIPSVPPTTIQVSAKSLKNISVKSRDQKLLGGGQIKNYGYFVYGVGVSSYEKGDEIRFDMLDNINDGNTVSTGTTIGKISKIDINSSINFSESTSYTFEDIKEKEIYVELSSSVLKYNSRTGFVDTAGFGNDGSGTMATKDIPKIKFKYNPVNNSLDVISSDNNVGTVTVSYDESFSVKQGETKDFTIRYKWMKGNDTTNGEEFEITYSIELKS